MPIDLLVYAPLALPALAVLLHAAFGGRPWTMVAGAATAAAQFAAAVALAPYVLHRGPRLAVNGMLRADALTAFMLIVISAVALIAMWASVYHVAAERAAGRMSAADARRYGVLTHAFLAAMGGAVLADNLGLMWVALEATTVITAFLVGHRRDRTGLEAAWKYVVLCSVGIAMAFLGTVCLYAAALHAGGHGTGALNWTYLTAHAHRLDPGVVRLAAGLAVLGFGTKAGLAPMHAWLPDAHSQAPAPVSALMSGVLLSVAFTGILRYKVLTDVVLGPGYMRVMLVTAALASLTVAALLMIAQRDYKRMLAYSSIEHMGLAALGAAAGTRLAAAALLLHILGHGLVKAVAFTGAGQILQHTRTSRIFGVRGLIASRPALAGVFGLALAGVAGLPPFPLFASELGIARGAASAGLGWALAVALIPLLVIFAALGRHVTAMLLGPAIAEPSARAGSPAEATSTAFGLVDVAAAGSGEAGFDLVARTPVGAVPAMSAGSATMAVSVAPAMAGAREHGTSPKPSVPSGLALAAKPSVPSGLALAAKPSVPSGLALAAKSSASSGLALASGAPPAAGATRSTASEPPPVTVPPPGGGAAERRTGRGALTPLILALAAAAVLGTALGPLQPLLRAAAAIVGAH